jgi:hypothetical protein
MPDEFPIPERVVEALAKAQHEAERATYVAAGETTQIPWDAAEWPETECEEGWTKEQWLAFTRTGLQAALKEWGAEVDHQIESDRAWWAWDGDKPDGGLRIMRQEHPEQTFVARRCLVTPWEPIDA